jgi:hypothetical protein
LFRITLGLVILQAIQSHKFGTPCDLNTDCNKGLACDVRQHPVTNSCLIKLGEKCLKMYFTASCSCSLRMFETWKFSIIRSKALVRSGSNVSRHPTILSVCMKVLWRLWPFHGRFWAFEYDLKTPIQTVRIRSLSRFKIERSTVYFVFILISNVCFIKLGGSCHKDMDCVNSLECKNGRCGCNVRMNWEKNKFLKNITHNSLDYY